MNMTQLFNTDIFHELKCDIILTEEERETLNKIHFKYLDNKMTETRFALSYQDMKYLKTMYDKSIQENTKRLMKDQSNRRLIKRLAKYRHNYRKLVGLISQLETMRTMLGMD